MKRPAAWLPALLIAGASSSAFAQQPGGPNPNAPADVPIGAAAPPPAPPPEMPPAPPAPEPAVATAPPEPTPEPYQGPSGRDRVVAYYTGLQLGIAPGIILPTNGGDPGFLLSLYGGYGIEAGSVIVIPGARATGAWPPDAFIGTFTPTMKLVFPLGAFAPYVEGGAGPGYVSAGEKVGLAVHAGGGFSVHPSSRFAIGAGVAYQTITGTNVSFLGPVLILSF